MEVDAVTFGPNMKVNVVASRSNIELNAVTFGPNIGPGVDAYRSNIKFDAVASRPTMELGPVSPPPYNFELDTVKDITPSWVMTFVRYFLNGVDLRNHNPSVAPKSAHFWRNEET